MQQIAFEAHFLLQDRATHWAAYIEPTGMTVYDENRIACIKRVGKAIEFFVHHYGDWGDRIARLRRYLDMHGVPSLVTDTDEPSRPLRITPPRGDYRYAVTVAYPDGEAQIGYECYLPDGDESAGALKNLHRSGA